MNTQIKNFFIEVLSKIKLYPYEIYVAFVRHVKISNAPIYLNVFWVKHFIQLLCYILRRLKKYLFSEKNKILSSEYCSSDFRRNVKENISLNFIRNIYIYNKGNT